MCHNRRDISDPMNRESSVLNCEPVVMGAHHFAGVGAVTIGDHYISPMVDIGIHLSSVDDLHHTSHVFSSIRAADDLEVVSTLPSLEGHVQSDWHPPSDIEASRPRSAQLEPANSIQLAPVAQPLYVFLSYPSLSITT